VRLRLFPLALSLRDKFQVLIGAGILLGTLAACGGSASARGCRKAGEQFPRRAVTVQLAAKRQGELVLVSGAFFARDGKPQRICSGLVRGSPPRCGEPSLALAGVRDLAAFDHVSSSGHVQWVESATVGGRVEGHRLRFELACATERVQEAFRDRTGETLTLNTFGSNVAAERLDFASLPEREPARLRRRYGYFSILVAVNGEPVRLDLQGRRPERSGIVWNKDAGRWVAIRRYGRGIALGWLAGRERRLDERWRRLDRILSGIATE
jgi:hypothetical protein